MRARKLRGRLRSLARSLACLASFTLACSAPNQGGGALTQAISGGAVTESGDWPGVAWLDNGCTGVLVASDLVVYAGHCGEHVGSAWLGQDLDIVVDDEARTARVVDAQSAREIAIRECRVHPNTTLGDGSDVAFCTLREAALDEASLPPIALGCARERIRPGSQLTLVGFGTDATGVGSLGSKRSVEAEVVALGKEIVVGDDERGTCPGDSGGPAFVALDGNSDVPDWALAGVLSSGEEGSYCGVGYFTDLSRVASWLEAASGRDLTSRSQCLCGSDYAHARGGCQTSPAAPAPGSWLAMAAISLVAVHRRVRRRGR